MSDTENHPNRRTYLGSHSFPTIMGYGYASQSVFSLYNFMVGNVDEDEPTESMEWGLRLEDIILDHFSAKNGLEIKSRQVFRRHHKYKHIGGTADGRLAKIKSGVDAKNISADYHGEWGESGSNKMPKNIICQCHHFNMLFNTDCWYVGALFHGNEYRQYVVERDKEMDELILYTLNDFWYHNIVGKNQPEIDSSKGARDFLNSRFDSSAGDIRAATLVESEMLHEYASAKHEYDGLDETMSLIKNRLRESIGNDKGITCDEGRVSISKNGRMTITVS